MAPPNSPSGNKLAQFAVISFDRHPETSTHIAQRVNARLRTFGLENVSTVNVNDLTPELASQLARVDYAIFIDSPRVGNQVQVKVRSLEAIGSEPAGSSMPAAGHSCDPGSLLALTHSAYGHHPQAWLIQVYMPKAAKVSAEDTDRALGQALSEVENLICPDSSAKSGGSTPASD